MAYTRLHWVESETPLSADNMNNIEDGIEELKSQKVDKVSGKALSDQNYTAAEKTKLAGIAEGAEVNRTYTAVTGKPAAAASPAFGGTVTVSQVAQDTDGQVSVTDRVITIPGNDATPSAHGLMTAADKTKLNGIETGATKNTAVATTSANGLMSSSDKTKLNGVETGAQVNRTYTAVTGKPTGNQTASFGGYVTVSQVEQDTTGQISVTDRRITFPSSAASTSAAGLMSASDKSKLNGIESGAQVNPGNATTSAAGLMSAADKVKLTGIATGAEVNQNAFSNVKVGDTTLAADSKTDTLTVSGGNHILLLPVASNDYVQIVTDIEDASSSTKGLMSASDKIKLDGIAASAKNINYGSVSIDNVSIDSGAIETIAKDASLSNWTLIGVIGFNIATASSGGQNADKCVPLGVYKNSNDAVARIKNSGSSTAKIKATFHVLYMK